MRLASQVFVPSKREPVVLPEDRKVYNARDLDHVPEDPFEVKFGTAKVKGLGESKPKPVAKTAAPAENDAPLSRKAVLEELEAAMASDAEEEEDWVLNDDFVNNALENE
eukprot:5122900-Pyramimonas_sp.AAC.1